MGPIAGKSSFLRASRHLAGLILSVGIVSIANAELIQDVRDLGENTVRIDFSQFAGDVQHTQGPVQVGGLVGADVEWFSNPFDSAIGDVIRPTGEVGYGLKANGSWNSERGGFVGSVVSDEGQYMEFTFNDGPVRGVGGFVNYALTVVEQLPDEVNFFNIQALDQYRHVMESYDIARGIWTPGLENEAAFRGILRAEKDIYAFRLTGPGFHVLDDLEYVRGPKNTFTGDWEGTWINEWSPTTTNGGELSVTLTEWLRPADPSRPHDSPERRLNGAVTITGTVCGALSDVPLDGNSTVAKFWGEREYCQGGRTWVSISFDRVLMSGNTMSGAFRILAINYFTGAGSIFHYATAAGPFVLTRSVNTITATAGSGGTIAPLGAVLVDAGTSQTFTITPDSGFSIADVLVNDDSVGAVPTFTFPDVGANHTIEAQFVANKVIAASAGPNGTISPSGDIIVTEGSDQSFTITPDPGYFISDVIVDGNSIGSAKAFTFTNVTSNHTIEASFFEVGPVIVPILQFLLEE